MQTQMNISYRGSSRPVKVKDPDFWYWVIIGLMFTYIIIRFTIG